MLPSSLISEFQMVIAGRSRPEFSFWAKEIASLLAHLQHDANLLERLASQSYLHDNGFLKIVLHADDDCSGQLRLHFWERGLCSPSNIHNHTRDFVSLVLCGEFSERAYVRAIQGAPEYLEYRAGIRGANGAYTMKRVGAAGLLLQEEHMRSAGQYYDSAFSCFHQLIPARDGPVLTLFFQGARLQTETNVFALHPILIGDIDCPALNPKLFRQKLRSAQEQLALAAGQ